jgi:hypothetical protein
VSTLLDCLGHERDGRQESTREDPFLNEVNFSLVWKDQLIPSIEINE